jgi:DNA-binding transcriptional LysR family regulator
MTLTQLKHMIELAKTGSFIKASENLFLTQPALSRSIKSLEDDLGAKIFDRQGRKSSLTVFGEEVFKRAQSLIDSAQELKQTNQNFKKGLSGHIKIGMGSGPGAILMTPLLQHIAIHYPHLHLDVIRGTTDMLTEALKERKLDALVVDARSLKPSSELNIEIIAETAGAFSCRKDHPITKLKKITISDLSQYPIASIPLSDEVERVLIDRYGAEANFDRLINLKCSEISSLVEVASKSDVILLSIRRAAIGLKELKLTPPLNATAIFGFVTIANRTESPLLAHIRKFIDKNLKD